MVPRYCEPSSGTCCTYSMETKLASLSRMQLEKNTKESIGKLASVLATRAVKFNGEYLVTSYNNLITNIIMRLIYNTNMRDIEPNVFIIKVLRNYLCQQPSDLILIQFSSHTNIKT